MPLKPSKLGGFTFKLLRTIGLGCLWQTLSDNLLLNQLLICVLLFFNFFNKINASCNSVYQLLSFSILVASIENLVISKPLKRKNRENLL
jgi:hypothetical protein